MFTEPDALAGKLNAIWPIRLNMGAPTALHAVKLQQMGGSRRTPLDLIHMNDIQPIARPGVIARPVGPAKPGPQSQTANAAHAIDANSHVITPQIWKM